MAHLLWSTIGRVSKTIGVSLPTFCTSPRIVQNLKRPAISATPAATPLRQMSREASEEPAVTSFAGSREPGPGQPKSITITTNFEHKHQELIQISREPVCDKCRGNPSATNVAASVGRDCFCRFGVKARTPIQTSVDANFETRPYEWSASLIVESAFSRRRARRTQNAEDAEHAVTRHQALEVAWTHLNLKEAA